MRLQRCVKRDGAVYLISLSSILIAASLRCRLGPIVGDIMAAVLFTVPIVVSALYGGFWPGYFCTLISAVIGIYLFMDPFYGYPLDVEANILIFTFIINGLIISYFGQRLQMQKVELAQKAEKLIAKNGELARASEQKDEFLVMLAHELRNPLAGISAAVEILRIIRADQYRTTQIADMILRQVRHMTMLVEDLFDASRITQGLILIEKKSIDMKEILHVATEQIQSRIDLKLQQFDVRLPEEPAFVCGDRTRLTQIIGNLLVNANKYSSAGGTIRAEIRALPSSIEVVIQDNGQGIDKEILPRVFDLFVQANKECDDPEGGLGIGLALVKRITELHGGTVSAYSAGIGRGSRFTVALPRL